MDTQPADQTQPTPQYRPLTYPRNKIVATIDHSDAHRVAAALDSAGFAAGRIVIITAEEIPRLTEPVGGSGLHGLLTRLWLGIGDDVDELEQARRALMDGHALIQVLVHGDREQECVRAILSQYGGNPMHSFGRWTVTPIADR